MTNSTTSQSIRCGFCANLGLPERVVTTHLVRDCKKLANTKCLQCGELGHTVGRCPLNRESKPKYSRKTDRKPFVVRDQPRKPAPTKPSVDADGFQVQGKRGSASKIAEVKAAVLAASVPSSFGGEVAFENKKPEVPIAQVKPSQIKPKGAWAAGAPKTKPVEVRPHQEIRPPAPKAEAKIAPKPVAVPKPVQYISNQSTGGNYAAEEELKQKAAKHGLTCWADDDDEELYPENDPFFQ